MVLMAACVLALVAIVTMARALRCIDLIERRCGTDEELLRLTPVHGAAPRRLDLR
jgi:hypothetical protein